MLTDLAIEKMPVPTTRREVPDGKISGLYLVLQPSGAKSWAFRYRIAGAAKKFTIGPYPTVSLKTARARAQKAAAEVLDGIDPSAEKRAAREAAKAATSTEDRIDNVVDDFVKKHLKPKTKASWAKEAERLLRVEIVPAWGKRRLGEITARDVAKRLEEIAERAPITANRVLSVFRKLCNWAISPKIGLITASPCAGIEAPTPERSRERVLSDDELRLIWQASHRVGWPFGPFARIILLTACRRDEAASMGRAELDLANETWLIPGVRTKNGNTHEIPLSDAAVAEFKALPVIEGSGFVFTTTGRTPISGFAHSKAALDKAILKLMREEAEKEGRDQEEVRPLERWTLHDLRRTVATNMQRLGVRLEVTEAILNHVSGSRAGIVGIYQRYEWTDEKRNALDAWSRRLGQITLAPQLPSNVVSMQAQRGRK